jgi:hypothetical protein
VEATPAERKRKRKKQQQQADSALLGLVPMLARHRWQWG